ncbi:ABC transporter substrate binding protein [Desulfitobacterium sp. THU1]|uniref:ABC transporter substrate binding protein n=1 Tax=Desulfitobacterium sp. THU1 TaxID=3138072 RepID=UPI00311D3AF7
MRNDRKNLTKKITIILALICFTIGASTSIYAQDDPRVLFISSYSQNYNSVPDQIAGIHEALDPHRILLDIEYMDTKRFDTQEHIDNFYASLQYKLKVLDPYDAIIVGDDQALEFATTHQKDLFDELPIIFLGINDVNRAEKAAQNEYITGVIEITPYKENIELALKFNSNVKRVIGILDNSITGAGHKDQFYGAVGYYPSLRFEDINTSEYTYEELAEIFQGIQDDSIILYLDMHHDRTGEYKTIEEAAAFISENTYVPVYRPSIGGVGQGIVGGIQISYQESGKIAGDMVLQVLAGTPIETITMIDKSPYYPIFDYQVLQKFNMDKGLVPHDAVLINKEVSYFEEHLYFILGIFGVLIVMLIISTLLGLDNLRHRSMQRKLKESNEELSATYEELAATEEELRFQYQVIEENARRNELLNQKYEHAINSTNSVVWEVNLQTRKVYFSENINNLFSLPLHSMGNIDRVMRRFLTGDTIRGIDEEIQAYLSKKKNEINLQVPLRAGSLTKWIKIQGKAISGDQEQLLLYGILTDVTVTKLQEEYIDQLAHNDYLTGLPNRMSFMNKLMEETQNGNPLIIIFMDIDNFKEINDTLGHVWGDKVLRAVAQRLSENACQGMFISRFGGDEFLVLSSNGGGSVEGCIKHIREIFAQPILIDNTEFNIKFSIGITRFPEDSTDIHQLIMNADTALYHVKRNGKNNHMFYNQEMQKELRNKSEVEGILRKSLQEDGIYLLYQPQVNVKTGEVESFEALARLKNHAIPPNVFIRIAEESDLICQIGRAVTIKAIQQLASWRDKGHPRKRISINFSSKQMRDKEYLAFLVETLKEYNLNGQYVELEITESILLEETNLTLEFLEQVKSMGISIALDDFGTGFSSINYLTYIPVDKVKLDKTLCDKFLNSGNTKVIDSIIALAHGLNLVITAEGIEEEWQYERLKASGCDMIQGYLFSKPLESDQADQIYDINFFQFD